MASKWHLVLAASTAAAALSAPPALAQTSGAPAAQSGGGLAEIVVTAQRREENVQSIPLAVSAFSPQQIEAAQLKSTADLVRFTPSVTGGLNTGTGSALSFYIRGLGSTEQIATFDVPVATYVDEIYVARQNANAVSLFDIERVEVLRGPQGTLFGRNTTGGAVSITTRKPAADYGFFVEGAIGSFERRMLRGSVDLPINDKILTKVSGFVVDDSGYGKSLTTGEKLNGEEAKGLRAAVRFLPNEKLTWDLSVDYIDQQKTTIGSSPVDPEYKSRSGVATTECDNNIREVYLNSSRGNCAGVESGGLTSNLSYDLGWSTISFITGFRTTDQNFALDFFNGTGARGGYTIANEVRNQQFTQEVKLVGETDRIKYVAGLFYLDEDNKTGEIDFAPPFGGFLADWTMYNTTESVAAYAQADISLTDALIATVGARYTEEKKTLAYLNGSLPLTATRPTSANVRAAGIPLSQDEQKITPRVALTYKLSNDKLLYASATNGFKSGGWNTRVTSVSAVTIFGPETAWTYEAGAKTEWFDRKLRVNATAYFQDVKDLQLLSGAGTVFSTRNAGDLEAKGIELEIAAAPTDALDIFATVAAADHEYKNTPRTAVGTGNVPCSNTPEPLQCTTTRDDPVRYPELQGTLGASYTVPLEQLGGSLTFNGSASYSQTYWTSTYNDSLFVTAVPFGGTTPITRRLSKVPPTTLVNLGAVYRSTANNWEAALECSNCTEEYYATSSLFNIGYYNDPRRVTFRVKYTY